MGHPMLMQALQTGLQTEFPEWTFVSPEPARARDCDFSAYPTTDARGHCLSEEVHFALRGDTLILFRYTVIGSRRLLLKSAISDPNCMSQVAATLRMGNMADNDFDGLIWFDDQF